MFFSIALTAGLPSSRPAPLTSSPISSGKGWCAAISVASMPPIEWPTMNTPALPGAYSPNARFAASASIGACSSKEGFSPEARP